MRDGCAKNQFNIPERDGRGAAPGELGGMISPSSLFTTTEVMLLRWAWDTLAATTVAVAILGAAAAPGDNST